jgi:hypothetical protein
MKDVTELIWDFAEARRSLWNTHFRRRFLRSKIPELIEDFQEIEHLLLRSLLWRSVAPDRDSSDATVEESLEECLELVLREGVSSVRVLISEEEGGVGGRWSEGFELSRDLGVRLEFVEIFDWEQTGFLSGALCRARIAALEGQSNFVGRHVLVELLDVRFLYHDEQMKGPSSLEG